MHNQRIKVRTTLCRVDLGNRIGIAGIRGEAIDRLGGNRDDLAGTQKLHRRRYCSVISGQDPAIPQGI